MTYFDQRRALIDAHLAELAATVPAPGPLLAPIRDALVSPGKRVRGLLTIAVGEALGSRAEKDIKVGLIEPGFTGADLQYPDYPPEKQRELIHQHKMLRAEDIAASVHFMLTQPRRTAVSLMRVETRLQHP